MKSWLKGLVYGDDIVGALVIFLALLILFFSLMTPHFGAQIIFMQLLVISLQWQLFA